MLLTIDIGNTNIVFGLFSDKKSDLSVLGTFRIETRHNRTADEYFALFQPNFEKILSTINHQPSTISKIIFASVVPQTKYEIENFCKKHIGIKPINVSDHKNNLGIKINLDNPEEVGADRLVNAVAAFQTTKKASIIVDFGTATTFDVIDSKGNYQGGVIAPGINLSMSALQRAASKLPKIAIEKPSKVIGKSTRSAMQSGVYYGYLGMVERLIDEISKELKQPKISVIATGGLAKFYKSPKIDFVDDELTLKGLKIIVDRMVS